MMARHRKTAPRGRLVDPGTRIPPPEGVPAWVGQAFGVALILGDFFLGRRLVDSFDAFSDGGLSGIGDPFAWMLLLGLAGWWVVVLGWSWVGDPERPVPMSGGAGVTALVMALVTAVLLGTGLGMLVPPLAITQGDRPNALGIGLVTALFLALAVIQWWRLQAGDPMPVSDPSEGPSEESPEIRKESPVPGRMPPGPAPAVRLVAALLLLPAGWALMAPGDLLALRAQAGIAVNWQGTLEQAGAAAIASLFSAGAGMLLAFGPRALASRVLGEGTGAWAFFSGLWLSHWIRLVLALLGS